MKNINLFQYTTALVFTIFFVVTGCQNFDEPPFGDFPLDGPEITLTFPNPNGSTIIRSVEPITSIIMDFSVSDDIAISNIIVQFDGTEIANMSEFTDPKMVDIDDLLYDNVNTGSHTVTITAIDSDGNEDIVTTTFIKEDTPPYNPLFGEIFYMSFEDTYTDLVSNTDATSVGSPTFGEGKIGQAYDGAADSRLEFPSEGLAQGTSFSTTFWLKIDPSDGRSGIINISTPTPAGPADKSSGFGLIREGGADSQRFILLAGNGSGTTWVNPGAPATIDPTLNQWVHFGITFSDSKASLYMDGKLVGQSDFTGIDWTGVGDLVIMSGDPNFNGWNHKTEKGLMDELRIYDRTLSESDIQTIMVKEQAAFYMNFDDTYMDLVSNTDATIVGSPSFDDGVFGKAYKGAADSRLEFPSEGLAQGTSFSTTFWLKIDPSDGRSGIINISTPTPAGPADKSSGFGLIREGGADSQRFILLAGNGSGTTWVNPGAPATIDPTLNQWVHFGITFSDSKATLYMDGELVGQSDFTGIDWTGVGDLVIMSGDPNFNGWNHKTEKGLMDDLYIFHKTLTQEEIRSMVND
ncbi:LamG domain-containing protein [Aegicerativicinus sediminis]|uniref:LamG domain-containing protein n=1 Tax=Aegicerativicinus sediminis TaxID=2893202 RepID=UPI001E42DA22|nr:LamG domain-containing protein [Aegicerativicinus sediminis]